MSSFTDFIVGLSSPKMKLVFVKSFVPRVVSAFFGVSYDTLNNFCIQEYEMTFVKKVKELHEYGKASLRRTQFKIAEKGNSAMAIFLGKQYLGQTDKAEQTNIERVAIVSDMPQEDEEDSEEE